MKTPEEVLNGLKEQREYCLYKYDREELSDFFEISEIAIEVFEKRVPKKPIRNDKCTCPTCETYNEAIKKRRNTVVFDIVYCWHCGQAIEIKRSD